MQQKIKCSKTEVHQYKMSGHKTENINQIRTGKNFAKWCYKQTVHMMAQILIAVGNIGRIQLFRC